MQSGEALNQLLVFNINKTKLECTNIKYNFFFFKYIQEILYNYTHNRLKTLVKPKYIE